MKKRISFAILIFSLLHTAVSAQQREEFNGPFPSWANLKTMFGAKGNGSDDDTHALQLAINNFSCPPVGYNIGRSAYMVIYLPAGTYCISSTLVMRGKIGITLIGEDPERTVIKWTGADKDTVLWCNGSSYFRISRLSWDANGRKDMEAIGIHWKDRWRDVRSMSFAPLNIEISDCYFTGGFRYGVSGGTVGGAGTGANDSEVTIRRCVFSNCTLAGIEIEGYNALDYWIWDCRFEQCHFGVNCTYGNYHVYRSFFSGSSGADVHNTNGYYTSVRGCYSQHALRFSYDEGKSSNPFKRTFQDNTISSPIQAPVQYFHTGKVSLWGNRLSRQSDSTYKHSVYYNSWAASNYELLSLHNTYTLKDPFQYGGGGGYGRLYSVGDDIRPGAELPSDTVSFLQRMDPAPRRTARKIFEVPPGAGTDTIQDIIWRAAALKGQRPVVHFAVGIYYIAKTLLIPANSDMQIEGDGLVFASVLAIKPGTVLTGPIFLVKGPSYITVRDLQIGYDGGTKQDAGIVFEGVDQPGSQAHLDQIYSKADTSLYVGGLDYLYVEKDNSFFTAGNYISGGPLVRTNKGTASVSCFGGQFARLMVNGNARFLAKDCWWEGPERLPLNLSGSGSITIDGAMIAPAGVDSLPTILIGKFKGSISLLNMYVQGALSVQENNPSLNLLVWNILFYHKMDPLDFLRKNTSYKGVFAGLNAQCFRSNDPACRNITIVNDQFCHVTDPAAFMDAGTAQDRLGSPRLFTDLPPGKSNICISRVCFGLMERGVAFGL